MHKRVAGILLAGGSGTRMGARINKVLLPVAGFPCIARSASALAPFIDHLVLVGKPAEKKELLAAVSPAVRGIRITFASGGATRQESVSQGIKALSAEEKDDITVLIHDGARCLVEGEVIRRVIDSVSAFGTGIAAIPVTDTLRSSEQLSLPAGNIVPREGLWSMQTPQGATLFILREAFRRAEEKGFQGTDDAAVLSFAGFPVYLTMGSRMNLKITTGEDLIMAEALLQHRNMSVCRVGHGYDVHQLAEGRKLILCGLEIPYSRGLLGHSDADVAVHALMDALLGAAALGDIGRHFPDSDEHYRGISSMVLLSHVMKKLREAGYVPVNADITIIAQQPKLAPYIQLMTEKTAAVLNLPQDCVNIKATTTEHLGFEGRMEGISAQAVCLIQPLASPPCP